MKNSFSSVGLYFQRTLCSSFDAHSSFVLFSFSCILHKLNIWLSNLVIFYDRETVSVIKGTATDVNYPGLYDIIPQIILADKWKRYRVHGRIITWIRSGMDGHVQSSMSKWKALTSAVPQGSIWYHLISSSATS